MALNFEKIDKSKTSKELLKLLDYKEENDKIFFSNVRKVGFGFI